jgi:hypothetical protein
MTPLAVSQVKLGKWYPQMPPMLPGGEGNAAYTDRLTGADRSGRRPYDHPRNRQCSIGYHRECSDADGLTCHCPCHREHANRAALVAEWNLAHPVGTVVSFPAGTGEPDVPTTSKARVDGHWPVVELRGFPHPVTLSWVRPAAPGRPSQVTALRRAYRAKRGRWWRR